MGASNSKGDNKGPETDYISRLSDHQKAEYKDAFDMFDTNRDGKISKSELKNMLETLGQKSDAKEVNRLMVAADLDKDNHIDFNEFVQVMIHYSPPGLEEQLRDAFSLIDDDNSGKISSDEIKNLLNKFGDQCSQREVEEIIREIDLDGDGEVDFEEFVKIFSSKSGD